MKYEKFDKNKLIPSAVLIALLGSTGASVYLETVADREGFVPHVYADPVGIDTYCFGNIEGGIAGKTYTIDECVRKLNEHSEEIIKPLRRAFKDWDKLPEKTRAALASMSYNIGNGAMARSSVAQYFNVGEWEHGCKRMAEIYKSARGVELKGLALRRKYESDLCLEGLREMNNDQLTHKSN